LLALAWVREIVAGFLGIFGVPAGSGAVKIATIILATILMFVLDFSINTGQYFIPIVVVLLACRVSEDLLSDYQFQFRQESELLSLTMLRSISRSLRMPGQVGSRAWAIFLAISPVILICRRPYHFSETRNSKSSV
jgi:hypothetical protein